MSPWLKGLPEAERHAIRPVACAMAMAGRDAAVPAVGKRAVGGADGPPDAPHGACAALPLRGHLVALHGFIKKTRTTPDEDLALGRRRQRELT